ncbi:DUF559 domain-containing protein [Arthrobacter sp. ISL-30]|uniref:DUF559 domain-containing protein n=1 Tax=Arthrobacter sp. ISL-30 TaxID=2819109 RepID=UPI001BEAE3A7|nr:DUF559 domain-containing protein [Arthrobacter sp. ISL-30]MBT2512236.1 DUF559 domain-containing protein [Arthrobacter sp. ISL-30]
MRRPSPLLEALQGRSFSLKEQRDAGLPAHRAWQADLRVASRGIRVPWDEAQDLLHSARLLTDASPGCICCRSTAALLWKCPLPFELQRELTIHLTQRDGGSRPVRKGVTGHRMVIDPADVQILDRVPLTSPARTWLDLAAVLPLDDLVAAADHFICQQSRSFGHNRTALCTLEDLRNQAGAHSGMRGIRIARVALDLARVGADSVPETKLRLALSRQGLPEPELRYVVCDPTGWELAWPDLAYPRFRVVVNYDGSHHLEAAQKESDIRRDESLAALGWTSITITAGQVRVWGFDGVVYRVRDALVRGGWRER